MTMPVNDPVMALLDKLPLHDPKGDPPRAAEPSGGGPAPFGLRFAMTPLVRSGEHEKSYYTVTVQEATQISRDGKVEVIQDSVQRERED
jgi:hypothetical protein